MNSNGKQESPSATRRMLATVAVCAFVLPVVGMTAMGGKYASFDGLTDIERQLMEGIDVENAMELAEFVSQGKQKIAGTDIDHQTAELLRGKFVEIGLDNVRLEEFPVDTWDLLSADDVGYAVDGFNILTPSSAPVKELMCTVYSSSPTTGPEGIVGELVDVGLGTNDDIIAAGDVEGKIMLMKRDDTVWGWNSMQAAQAEAWGAAAIVNYGSYDEYPLDDAIKQDSVGDYGIALFSISENDAAYLKDLMADDVVTVRLYGETDYFRSYAYNVVGEIPGTVRPDEYIVIQAHYDNWWVSYNDDCTGIGAMIDMAQNLMENYVNERTVIVIATGSEEAGGLDDSWFNWLIGAEAFVNSHTELRDKLVACINLDVISADWQFWFDATPELREVCDEVVSDLGLDGPVHPWIQDTWQDSWVYAQIGYPAVHLWSWGMFYDSLYHTDLDTIEYCIPNSIAVTEQIYTLLLYRLDSAYVIPVKFDETYGVVSGNIETFRAAAKNLDPGIDFSEVADALERFCVAKDALDDALQHSGDIDPETADAVNSLLLAATREANSVLYEIGGDALWDAWYRGSEYVETAVLMDSVAGFLENGNIAKAVSLLETYTTMSWGKLVLPEAYHAVIDSIYSNMGWGEVCVVDIVDVYGVWESLLEKSQATGKKNVAQELAQVEGWRDWALQKAAEDMAILADGFNASAAELENAAALLDG